MDRSPLHKKRAYARKRLKKMEEHGNILDWDFIPGEDCFLVTLLNGVEVEMTSEQLKAFQLGYLSRIMQINGKGGAGAMALVLQEMKIVKEGEYDEEDEEDPSSERR